MPTRWFALPDEPDPMGGRRPKYSGELGYDFGGPFHEGQNRYVIRVWAKDSVLDELAEKGDVYPLPEAASVGLIGEELEREDIDSLDDAERIFRRGV